MARIAFIGLGNMGSGMAANQVKAGHEVWAFDLNPDAVQALVEKGAKGAASVSEAIQGADAVITMLPAGKHVRGVYEGEGGVIAQVGTDTVLIDCSTIDVESARAVGEVAKAKGVKFVDAPVSGGVAAAEGGTLTFMVGGDEPAFKAAELFLNHMGKAVIHAGDVGAGQAAKICNNMLLGIHMIGTCEAFNLARKLGLSDQSFFDIASKASGQNWSLTSYCPAPGPVPTAPSNRDYQPGFAVAMMLKDLKLAQDAAQQFNAHTPMGERAKALYEDFDGQGGGGMDFSAMIKFLEGETGATSS